MNLRKILLFQIHNEIVLYSSGEQGRLGCEYIEGGHFIIKFEQDLYISYLIQTADLVPVQLQTFLSGSGIF